MKCSIYKYELSTFSVEVSVKLPVKSEILSAGTQGDCVFIWVKVPNNEYETETVEFLVAPTGFHEVKPLDRFIGTCFIHGGAIVAHVFVRGGQ